MIRSIPRGLLGCKHLLKATHEYGDSSAQVRTCFGSKRTIGFASWREVRLDTTLPGSAQKRNTPPVWPNWKRNSRRCAHRPQCSVMDGGLGCSAATSGNTVKAHTERGAHLFLALPTVGSINAIGGCDLWQLQGPYYGPQCLTLSLSLWGKRASGLNTPGNGRIEQR